MRNLIVAAAAALLASQSLAIPPLPPPPSPAAPPKLLIVISVDQFSADLLDEYRPQFTGGLARLASGAAFHNGYQSHATTETCPGHSTILTGDRPARTGIISNGWATGTRRAPTSWSIAARTRACRAPDSDHYKLSPAHLRVPTLGDLMKQRSAASRVVAVAGKDRSALMMSGRVRRQRWYWSDKGFVTDLAATRRRALPPSIPRSRASSLRRRPLWSPRLSARRRRSRSRFPTMRRSAPGAFARAAGDAKAFRASPRGRRDRCWRSPARWCARCGLGRGASTDLLAVGLSATDYVGHTYGTGGQEMCLQLLELDRDLGDFFARLDGWGIDYAVALTADHGGLDIPERARLTAWPMRRGSTRR